MKEVVDVLSSIAEYTRILEGEKHDISDDACRSYVSRIRECSNVLYDLVMQSVGSDRDSHIEESSGIHPISIFPPSTSANPSGNSAKDESEMASFIVHDLKSPLSTIAMNIENALGEIPPTSDNAAIRASLEDSRIAAAQLFRMLSNLRDITRSTEHPLDLQRVPMSLGELLEVVVHRHTSEARMRKIGLTSSSTVLEPVDVDADIFTRVVENLVESALRMTRAGCRISLSADEKSLSEGAEVTVRVAHDGPSISNSDAEHIFDRTRRAANAGIINLNRGLGLHFCKIAVEAHGGKLEYRQEESRKSFVIRLPRLPPVESYGLMRIAKMFRG